MTNDANPASSFRNLSHGLTELLVFFSGTLLGFGSVYTGLELVYRWGAVPVTDGWFWPVKLFAVVCVVVLAAFVGTISLLILISVVVQRPDRGLYFTFLSRGGTVGILGASISLYLHSLKIVDYIGAPFPTETSLISITAIALPLFAMFYTFSRPTTGRVREKRHERGDESDEMSAEEIAEDRVRINEDKLHQQWKDLESESNIEQNTEGTEEPTAINSELQFDWTRDTGISFADVGGMDDVITVLEESIILPLTTHRKEAEDLGVSVPNVLLSGPPGTGKTYIVMALASELGFPFTRLGGADITSKFINESQNRVNELFRESRQVAEDAGGAVVFLDEIDSVLKSRDTHRAHEEDLKTVNEFLRHLEETSEHRVLFIGATNRRSALDEAATRPGRFDLEIEIAEPDRKARKSILEAQLKNRQHNLTEDDIEDIVVGTHGLTAADLASIIERAARVTLARGGSTIRSKDVRQALGATILSRGGGV